MPRRPLRLVRSYVDVLTKTALGFCVGHTLAPLGLDLPPIAAGVPSERLVVRTRSVDIAFRLTDDTYVDIEEITGDHQADLYDVLVRAAIVAEEHRRPVRVFMLYTDRVHAVPETLEAGSLGLRVQNVYGPLLDGDAALATAEARAASGGLRGEDAMALAFIGVMRHRTRTLVAAMRDGLRLAAALPRAREREGCAAALVLLGQRRLGAEEIAALTEVFAVAAPGMAEVLQRIGREKGKAEGKVEGLAEGKAEGRAEGKVEGLAEGKAEGLAEGKAEDVLRVLRLRCGEPAPDVALRVAAERDIATLDRWLALAVSCTSVETFAREAFAAGG